MANQDILIIDDDNDTVEILSFVLTEAGYKIITGADALALYEIEKQPPALIIMDHWLNGRSGHDLCRQLKSSPQTALIPVLLLSATLHLETTAKSAAADAYLAKPFDLDELIQVVNRLTRI